MHVACLELASPVFVVTSCRNSTSPCLGAPRACALPRVGRPSPSQPGRGSVVPWPLWLQRLLPVGRGPRCLAAAASLHAGPLPSSMLPLMRCLYLALLSCCDPSPIALRMWACLSFPVAMRDAPPLMELRPHSHCATPPPACAHFGFGAKARVALVASVTSCQADVALSSSISLPTLFSPTIAD